MSDKPDRAEPDTWNAIMGHLQYEDDATVAEMTAVGEVTEIYSGGYEEGWGHHSLDVVVRDSQGRYWHAESSGCSCNASDSVTGPMTEDEALRHIPNEQAAR